MRKQDKVGFMSLLYLFHACMVSILCLSGCTYSITMIHTEGQATDVVDETSSPSADLSIPAVTL